MHFPGSMLLKTYNSHAAYVKHSSSLSVKISHKISDSLEISSFQHTRVVISSRERLPDFRRRLADFEEAAHVARSASLPVS
jgi:hypothetical protein